MRVVERPFDAALLLEQVRHVDARGSIARDFCRAMLADAAVRGDLAQANLSLSRTTHTLRGQHPQLGRSAEIRPLSPPFSPARLAIDHRAPAWTTRDRVGAV